MTDRSDASGTGYFDAATDQYRLDLVARYFGAMPALPRVLGPAEPAGRLRSDWGGGGNVTVSAGAGDNAAAGLGLSLEIGKVVVSVGTSGTVFTRSLRPLHDSSGLTARFADAAGAHLPLLCTLNAARVLTSTAELLCVDLRSFEDLARSRAADSGGLTLLPYFDGERTPNLPDASGELFGITRSSFNPENVARAAVLAIANSLADSLDLLRGADAQIEQVVLVGGGAKSQALRSVLADTLGVPVIVPEAREYVAIGAARQGAWATTGALPEWRRVVEGLLEPSGCLGCASYRSRYVARRAAAVGSAEMR